MRSIFINILSFLIITAALVAAYQPALFQDYVYHDDVTYFYMTPTMPKGIGYERSFAEGRFLGSNIYVLYGQLVDSISDLRLIRWLSAVQLILSCTVLFFILRRWLNRRYLALLLAVTIFTLPSFQIFVTHAGMAFQSAGLLLSLLAGALALQIPTAGVWWKRCFHITTLMSLLLMYAALVVYPPTAMCYWVVVAVHLLSFYTHKPQKGFWLRTVNLFFIGLAAIGSFAVTLRLVKERLMGNTQGNYNPYQISYNLIGKMKWFFTDPLNNVLHFWNVFPESNLVVKVFFLGIVIIAVFYLGKVIGWWKSGQSGRSSIIAPLIVFLGLCLTTVLSFLPNLVAMANVPFYRCLVALVSVIFLVIFFCVYRLVQADKMTWTYVVLTLVLTGLCCFGIRTSNQMITKYRVVPSQTEYAYFKNILLDSANSGYKHLHVIQPQEKKMRARSDEFGMLTTRYKNDVIGFATIAFQERLQGVMELEHVEFSGAHNEARFIFRGVKNKEQKAYYSVRITTGIQRLPDVGVPQGLLIVDMTRLMAPDGALAYLNKFNYKGKDI